MATLIAFFQRDSGGGEMMVEASSYGGAKRWVKARKAEPHPKNGDTCAIFADVPDEPEVSLRWWWTVAEDGSDANSEVGCAIVNTPDPGMVGPRGTEPVPPGGPRARYAPSLVAVSCEGFAPRRPAEADPFGMRDFASGS